ncbi:MAG TPA: MFS transporter, partial [Jatrophihabitans sp.]|nr:MFS transporter [Jatrophihabitans sp.]
MVEVRRARNGRGGLGQGRHVIASIAISGFGTWGYNVGIAVYAYERTHSAAWVAAITVGRYVPALVLSWLAGRLVDRLPRRSLAVAADAGCAAVMAVLALLASADAPLWLITLVAAISSTLARLQGSAVLSLAADVVVESQLARASVLAGAAEAVATAAGSAAASVMLIRYTPPSLFLLNAATFAVSALVVARIKSGRTRTSSTRPTAASGSERSAGAVFWPLQATRAVAAFVYGLDVVLLAVIASRQLHSGTSGYGWLLAAAGAGGLIAVVPSRRDRGRTTAKLATFGVLLYAVPLAAFALDPGLFGGVGVQIARGVGSVLVSSSAITGLQRAVPSRISGQVFGQTQSLVLAGTTLGAVVAPSLLSALGLDSTLLIAAAAPVAMQVALFPFLVRFDHREAGLLAALEPRVTTLRELDLLHDASRSTLYEIA